jgi:hypothetical protein
MRRYKPGCAGMRRDAPGCARMRRDARKGADLSGCAWMRRDAPGCAGMRQDGPGCTERRRSIRMRLEVPRCADLRRDAPGCAGMRKDARKGAGMHREAQGSILIRGSILLGNNNNPISYLINQRQQSLQPSSETLVSYTIIRCHCSLHSHVAHTQTCLGE